MRGQIELVVPTIGRIEFVASRFQSLSQCAVGLDSADPIGQPGMMARDQIGKKTSDRSVFFQGQRGASPGMGRWLTGRVVIRGVEAVALSEIILEGGGGLSEVMEKASETGPFGGVKRGGEFRGTGGDVFEVLAQRLPVVDRSRLAVRPTHNEKHLTCRMLRSQGATENGRKMWVG